MPPDRSEPATDQPARTAERVVDPSPAIDRGRSRAINPRAANAVTHGLTATHPVVLPGESPADWQQFQSRVVQSLVGQTDDPVLVEVAGRVASCLWRLRRVDVAEASALQSRLAAARGQGVGYLLEGDVLDRVSRYESHLSREIGRAIALLRLLLEARQAASALDGGENADDS